MLNSRGRAVPPSKNAFRVHRDVAAAGVRPRSAGRIADAEQVGRLNDAVRALLADSIPPFIAVDQEGGNVIRIDEGMLVLPGNMALGATRSMHLAYEAGKAQAEDLRRLGFNMNLA